MDNESTICRQPNNTSENAHFLDGKVIVKKKLEYTQYQPAVS